MLILVIYCITACSCVIHAPPMTSSLESEPTHLELMNMVATEVPTRWRDIGLELGLTKPELDKIELESPTNSNKCFSAMFHLWETKITSPYKWATVIQALEAPLVDNKRLARKLTLQLSKSTGLER